MKKFKTTTKKPRFKDFADIFTHSIRETHQVVSRSYNTKKGRVTKEYTYTRYTPVEYNPNDFIKKYTNPKTGEVTYKFDKTVFNTLDRNIDNSGLSQMEKIDLKTNLRRVKYEIESGEGIYRDATGKIRPITIRSIAARVSTLKVERYLINFGFSVEEVCLDLNVDESVLLNDANWNDSTFVGPDNDGNIITVKFTYNYNDAHSYEVKKNEKELMLN